MQELSAEYRLGNVLQESSTPTGQIALNKALTRALGDIFGRRYYSWVWDEERVDRKPIGRYTISL